MDGVVTRPSAAPRWTRCALSPTMSQRVGERPAGDAAMEGTCAAWVAEMVLTDRHAQCADMIGMRHENGWEVDDEMADHIQGYVDHCRAAGGEGFVEKFVTLSAGIAGTLDHASLSPDGVLTVRDLKYGFKVVKPTSEQLVIYAAALVTELTRQGRQVWQVVTEIYQPRAFVSGGAVRSHTWQSAELLNRAEWIIARAADCHAPSPVATPGPHCLYCDGAGRGCDALAATSAEIVATISDTEHGHMTPPALARQLSFLKWANDVVKAAFSAAETEAIERHRAGEPLPGWGLSERQGQTRVTASRAAIKALTGKDVDVAEPRVKVGDLRKAKLTDAQIAVLTTRPFAGFKLEPLDTDALRQQFKGI